MTSLRTQWLSQLYREKLLSLLLLAAIILGLMGHLTPKQAFDHVEWKTIGVLLGLLCLSCALEESGYFQWFGTQFLRRVRNERLAALIAVLGAAALSAVVTNDISLFIVVPITIGMSASVGDFPVGRLIIFEALAVNAGSAITPIGNPQNLFLWQTSGVSFAGFIENMLPLGICMLIILAGATCFAFPGKPIAIRNSGLSSNLDRRLLLISIILYPSFLAAVDLGHTRAALLGLLAIFAWAARRVFARVDWTLLAVFILMFIDLRSLSGFSTIRNLALQLLTRPHGSFQAGVLFSQVISNVPSTILLQSVHAGWRELAWGVNIGGFGLAIGSLANLIALRLAKLKGLWREFHVWSVAMLFLCYGVGVLLLAGALGTYR